MLDFVLDVGPLAAPRLAPLCRSHTARGEGCSWGRLPPECGSSEHVARVGKVMCSWNDD